LRNDLQVGANGFQAHSCYVCGKQFKQMITVSNFSF
jgi:hypothetical protein